ncbi:MAG: hypothetical protein ABI627_21240, partial [Polyangiaceae bacterium]
MSIVRFSIRGRMLAAGFSAFLSFACSGAGGASNGNPSSGGAAGGAGNAAASGGAPASSSGGAAAVPASGGSPSGGAGGLTNDSASGTGGSAGGAAPGLGGAGTGGATQAGSGGQGLTGGSAGAAGASAGSGGAQAVACPAVALTPGTTTHMIQSGGMSREYLLHVPSGYLGKAAVPLIVDFHGHGGTGTTQAKDSPYPKVVDGDNVVMAFPTAVGDWNMGPCCADGIDDIAFAKALVTDV